MSAAASADPPSFQEVARYGASSSRTSGIGSGSGSRTSAWRTSPRTGSMGPTAGLHLSSGLLVHLCHQSLNFRAYVSEPLFLLFLLPFPCALRN